MFWGWKTEKNWGFQSLENEFKKMNSKLIVLYIDVLILVYFSSNYRLLIFSSKWPIHWFTLLWICGKNRIYFQEGGVTRKSAREGDAIWSGFGSVIALSRIKTKKSSNFFFGGRVTTTPNSLVAPPAQPLLRTNYQQTDI